MPDETSADKVTMYFLDIDGHFKHSLLHDLSQHVNCFREIVIFLSFPSLLSQESVYHELPMR